MRAILKARPEPGVELTRVAVPSCGKGELLIRVHTCGVCGTDISIYHWKETVRSLLVLPRVIGHEFVGVVEDAGAGTTAPVGSRVTADTDGGCGTCRYCRRGYFHACERQLRLGTQRDGGLAEWVVVPERSIRVVPDSLDDRTACLLEPLAAAVHGLEHLPWLPGASAAVIGPGPMGLLGALALRGAGAEPVVVIGLPDDGPRLETARRLGFESVTTDDAPALAAETGPLGGFDVVYDSAGAAASLALATTIARFGAHITVPGLGASGTFDPNLLVEKELHLHGSWRRVPATWDRTIALALRCPDLAELIDGVYSLDDGLAAFEAAASRRHVKTLVEVAQ